MSVRLWLCFWVSRGGFGIAKNLHPTPPAYPFDRPAARPSNRLFRQDPRKEFEAYCVNFGWRAGRGRSPGEPDSLPRPAGVGTNEVSVLSRIPTLVRMSEHCV